jgi:hypothetical protein
VIIWPRYVEYIEYAVSPVDLRVLVSLTDGVSNLLAFPSPVQSKCNESLRSRLISKKKG